MQPGKIFDLDWKGFNYAHIFSDFSKWARYVEDVVGPRGQYVNHSKYLCAANDKTDADASFAMAYLYEINFTGWKKLKKEDIFKLYLDAAELNHQPALFIVIKYYEKQHDYKQASIWWKRLAETGNDIAQNKMGLLYLEGSPDYCIDKNEKEAAHLFKLAADQENPDAQENLARCYENGWGVAKDQKLGDELYRKAYVTLGNTYEYGWGNNTKDMSKAFRYYSLAAEKGDHEGLCKLGRFYDQGFVSKNKELATSDAKSQPTYEAKSQPTTPPTEDSKTVPVASTTKQRQPAKTSNPMFAPYATRQLYSQSPHKQQQPDQKSDDLLKINVNLLKQKHIELEKIAETIKIKISNALEAKRMDLSAKENIIKTILDTGYHQVFNCLITLNDQFKTFEVIKIKLDHYTTLLNQYAASIKDEETRCLLEKQFKIHTESLQTSLKQAKVAEAPQIMTVTPTDKQLSQERVNPEEKDPILDMINKFDIALECKDILCQFRLHTLAVQNASDQSQDSSEFRAHQDNAIQDFTSHPSFLKDEKNYYCKLLLLMISLRDLPSFSIHIESYLRILNPKDPDVVTILSELHSWSLLNKADDNFIIPINNFCRENGIVLKLSTPQTSALPSVHPNPAGMSANPSQPKKGGKKPASNLKATASEFIPGVQQQQDQPASPNIPVTTRPTPP